MKSTHSLIETICNQTGMSRRDLAILIGGHQSNLSRYLKGERDLPTANLLEMNNLYAILQSLQVGALPNMADEEQEALELQASNCQASATLLKQQLRQMQHTAQQCLIAQKMAEKLLENPTILPQKRIWAEMIGLAAAKKLRTNGRLKQNSLAIKINLLTKEANLYKKLGRDGEVKLK